MEMDVTEWVPREEAERVAREHYAEGWAAADDSRGSGLLALICGMLIGALGALAYASMAMHFYR